jgi:hypothetical protein
MGESSSNKRIGGGRAWASEAGREPDAEAVKAVLSAEADPFAEDLVRELARALGFCFA